MTDGGKDEDRRADKARLQTAEAHINTGDAAREAVQIGGDTPLAKPEADQGQDLSPAALAHVEQTGAVYRTAAEGFDMAVLAISGGALTLSVTFAKDMAPDRLGLCWLFTAWVLLVLCLVAQVVSRFTGAEANRESYAAAGERVGGAYDTATHLLNIAAIGLLTLGLACLAVFAGVNMYLPVP
jgi:hypothetical protein